MTGLRDLELAVLGLVWKSGPCTPYAIRRHFLDSPSSHWSGSAGAIYPLVQRLEERGLLASKDGTRGARSARVYTITPTGRAQLRRWITAPIPDADVSVSFDPIRTRVLFLAVAPPARRIAFLDSAARMLRGEVRASEQRYRRERERGDETDSLATLGALMVMRARLQWVERVGRSLRKRGGRGASPASVPPARASARARSRSGSRR